MKKISISFQPNAGILLLEALLAVVVLGVAITATVRSFTYAVRVYRLTGDYLTGTSLAAEKMAELEALPKLQEGESTGTFKAPDTPFSWDLRVEIIPRSKEDEKEATVDYFKVYLKVRRGSEDARTVSASTILIKKKEKEDDEKPKIILQGTNTR